jgi:hypothetical protein
MTPFDNMTATQLHAIIYGLDSVIFMKQDTEKDRVKMLKQAKHVLRVKHGLKVEEAA